LEQDAQRKSVRGDGDVVLLIGVAVTLEVNDLAVLDDADGEADRVVLRHAFLDGRIDRGGLVGRERFAFRHLGRCLEGEEEQKDGGEDEQQATRHDDLRAIRGGGGYFLVVRSAGPFLLQEIAAGGMLQGPCVEPSVPYPFAEPHHA
jgi:hypothetical protein